MSSSLTVFILLQRRRQWQCQVDWPDTNLQVFLLEHAEVTEVPETVAHDAAQPGRSLPVGVSPSSSLVLHSSFREQDMCELGSQGPSIIVSDFKAVMLQ